MEPRSRCALVWGATGFIGRHVLAALARRGWSMRALTRRGSAHAGAWANGVDWIDYDPHAPVDAFERAVAGAAVVFNLAGSSGAVASNRQPLESLDSNCRLQLQLLDACMRSGECPHIVFASSRLVYATAGRDPVTEEHPLAPRSVYAAHKLCIEHYHAIYAHRGAITYTACRISNPYGLDAEVGGKGYGFINALIQLALAGQPLAVFGRGLQLRDYIYIDDLVRALLLCAEQPGARNDTFNIGLGHSLSIGEAAARIQDSFGGGPIEYHPWPLEYEQVESGDFVLNGTKARALLGFAPAYTFACGLDDIRERLAPTLSAPMRALVPPPRTPAPIRIA